MAIKTYFLKGFTAEQIAEMKDQFNSKVQSIMEYKNDNPSIVLKLREIEAANARAELIEYNRRNNMSLELIG